ncbi:MAG: barstar family protein [Clostridia bacterium]|nr:barstar family protein [Clostridia bacterium]
MYQYKEKYTIDFSGVTQYAEIHTTIREALDWPDYYGGNWDAFWDCLTDMIGRPIYIEIIGLEVIENNFADAAETMLGILADFKHCDDDRYAHEINIALVRGGKRTHLS